MTTQGRAASARIVASLQASLEGGAWLSTADLAKRADCTDRAVRNYLAEAEQALGFAVERSAAAGGRVRYRKAAAHSATIEQVGLLLGKELLKSFFPVDGTSLARRSPAGRAEIVIAVRGAAVYDGKHKSALRRWLAVAEARPRRALVFDYRRPMAARRRASCGRSGCWCAISRRSTSLAFPSMPSGPPTRGRTFSRGYRPCRGSSHPLRRGSRHRGSGARASET